MKDNVTLKTVTAIAQSIKGKNDKLDLMNIKNFCSARDPVKSMIRQATGCEKVFVNQISQKGVVSRLYKEFSKLNSKKPNNPTGDISLRKTYKWQIMI